MARMSHIALIDYGSGNVRSVRRALVAAASEAAFNSHIELTSDPERIRRADRVVLPGVGHFADCAEGLRSRPGVVEAMVEAVRANGAPFLGVCVGMQLLADVGREDGETEGLGWIAGAVERISPDDDALPVPHMGWNALEVANTHPVLEGLGEDPHVYFTHSYVFNAVDEADVAARFTYGGAHTAAVARDNLFGTQFHPEKSQRVGLRLLANFLTWTP